MRFVQLFAVLILAMLPIARGRGMFMFEETKKVPIDRLFTNLQHRVAQKTNDARLTYQLARLHAMAYSTNLSVFTVTLKEEEPRFAFPGCDTAVPESVHLPPSSQARTVAYQHLTNAIVLYERALVLLKQSTNIDEQRWHVVPMQLGLAWCLDQAGRREEALAAYRTALKASWRIEVTGEFHFSEWVKDVWKDVSSAKNPLHARQRGYVGPGVCYSEEIIGYLLKLLDPVKDAKEIAKLKENQKTLSTMGRAITPILVPLEASAPFEELVAPSARVTFDLDGSGIPRPWGWITPKAAWLVFDADGTGRITSGLQMFGSVTFWIFWRDGYEALASLDDDGDRVLRGSELRGLALWHDRNGDGACDLGEVRPVGDYGITAISAAGQPHADCAAWSPQGVTFTNGTTRPTFDWIAPSR